VSAFFGLDHAMPDASRFLCRGAPGKDGIPVTFSRRVVGEIDPRVFSVHTRSGAILHPECATTAPANQRFENHTVLIVGELGREPDDAPLSVDITGHLALEGNADAMGLSAPVIPLAAGPTLVLALAVKPGSIESDCPTNTRQIVVVVWAGGVHPTTGATQDNHLAGYEVSTQGHMIKPFALGDLKDRDNYVHLCLDTDEPARMVSFSAGILADPRGDVNPSTSVDVAQ
jgi:hypothetical protein